VNTEEIMDRASDEWKTLVADAIAKPPARRSLADLDAIYHEIEMLRDELARGATAFERANQINRLLDALKEQDG
jgi:hypothetical protein